MSRVLLVPLDERPCCLQFVHRLADIAGLRLVSPPSARLGCFLTPGRPQALIQWYHEHCREVDAALVSLDMLAFGGLVASRRWEPTLEQALANLHDWLEVARGNCPVWAFQSVLRTAPTPQTSAEEVRQALLLVELSTLWARRVLGEVADEEGERSVAMLEARLPEGLLQRYRETRERNHRLNATALEWARRGVLRGLLLGIDDSKTMGWNVLEVRHLAQSLPERAWIAPGTDETAQLLLARLCHGGRVTRSGGGGGTRVVQVHWSHPGLPEQVTKYEDRCLGDLVEAQMAVCGLTSLEGGAVRRTPWQLFVYGRLGPQGEAEDQCEQLVPPGFLDALRSSLEQGRRVVVADVAHANGGDVALGRALAQHLGQLLGYTAWNTAGNTLGTALACLGCAAEQPGPEQRWAEKRFALERWLDDLVYQSRVRSQLKASLGTAGWVLDSQAVGVCERELASRLRRASAELGVDPAGRLQAWLPWSRLFEVAVEVELP